MNETEKLKVQARELATEISILRRLLEEKENCLEALAAENIGLRGELDLARQGNEPSDRVVVHKGVACGTTEEGVLDSLKKASPFRPIGEFFAGVKSDPILSDLGERDGRWFPWKSVRKLLVDRALFGAMLKSGKRVTEVNSPLPMDAYLCAVHAPANSTALWLYFHSTDFPAFEGDYVPELAAVLVCEFPV